MAITIDWGNTNVIFVPQADLTLVSGSLYQLDVNAFRLALKDLEDDLQGMPFPRTHNHNTEAVLGGLTFARQVEIIAPYSVEFEDGAYSVQLTGANNNIFDIQSGILVQNQVQVIPNNSAGSTSPGFTAEDRARLEHLWQHHGFDPDNPMTINEGTGEMTVGGTVRQWVGNVIKTLTRTT